MTDRADLVARLAALLRPRLQNSTGRLHPVTVSIDATAAKAGWSAETLMFEAQVGQGETADVVPLVLKRQVAGHALQQDPDLALQWNVMAGLEHYPDVPTPKPLAFDRDGSDLGQPAIIMTRMPGRIVPQNPNYNTVGWLADWPAERRHAVWRAGIEAMASIHRIDWRQDFGFLARGEAATAGLTDWLDATAQWLAWAQAGRSHPVAEQALLWLRRHQPSGAPVSLLWGDAIPANLLYDDQGAVTGIIDWEFAALGPGEADLAWWLYFDELFSSGMHVEKLEGLPTREECVAIYAAAAGREVRDLDYYLALAGLRMTIISIRAVDRLVAQGRFKIDNDAWLANPSSAWLARHLGLGEVTIGPDFAEFTQILFGAR